MKLKRQRDCHFKNEEGRITNNEPNEGRERKKKSEEEWGLVEALRRKSGVSLTTHGSPRSPKKTLKVPMGITVSLFISRVLHWAYLSTIRFFDGARQLSSGGFDQLRLRSKVIPGHMTLEWEIQVLNTWGPAEAGCEMRYLYRGKGVEDLSPVQGSDGWRLIGFPASRQGLTLLPRAGHSHHISRDGIRTCIGFPHLRRACCALCSRHSLDSLERA